MAENLLKNCIPGVLSDRQVKELIALKLIRGVRDLADQVDYSSVDLTLADEGYRLLSGSVKPFVSPEKASYRHHVLEDAQFTEKIRGHKGVYALEPHQTYVFKLEQTLDAARLRNLQVFGQATAKSSVGRVDVLARLIVDGMNSYEEFTPNAFEHANGEMFVEITPMTFRVRVKAGCAVNQLRLFYGQPKHAEISGAELFNTVLLRPDAESLVDDSLSVDLNPVRIGGLEASAFCAHHNEQFIDLWREHGANPLDFWNIELARIGSQSGRRMLEIQKNAFYILRSREKIRLPKNIAVYCRAIDETIGEMRIHYAGFVHPFFGENRRDRQLGTPLIFEVRGHDVNVALIQHERMARLTFYRMSEDCKLKPKSKRRSKRNRALPNKKNKYNEQELELSGLFGRWPTKLGRRKNRLVKISRRR